MFWSRQQQEGCTLGGMLEKGPLVRRWIYRAPAKPNKRSEPSGPETATPGSLLPGKAQVL